MLVIGVYPSNGRPYVRGLTMRDVNRTCEQLRLGQCERETQFFSYAERPIAP